MSHQGNYELGQLSDPKAFVEALSLYSDDATLLRDYRTMYLIRRAEEVIGDHVTASEVRCPCHLGIGQEAVAVGVARSLLKTDRAFGAHRSHSHFLSMGANVESLFAEVLGRVTGCSKGMGGSMHLVDRANGFWGSVPIVAGTVPIAVGAALAAKKQGRRAIAVAYLGDGATEEGCVHEAMNFASTFKLPVLFVVENNLFSSHLHISLRQPASSVARFAQAHRIESRVVDGNDVEAVGTSAADLVVHCREGMGPGFLEAVTYRWRGHVGPREDIDVGVKRKDDLVAWKHRDPLRRLADAMIARNPAMTASLETLRREIDEMVLTAWSNAEKAPFPPQENLLSMVYSERATK